MAEIGAQLREARMRDRIDINEVETRTKIRAKYLRAMENEEWDLLPGEVYVRSFLRTYADYLGLDSRQLLDDFRRQYENPSDHEPPPIAPPSRERRERERQRQQRPRRGIPPWVVVVGVLIIAGVALYLIGTHTKKNDHNRTAASTTQTTSHQSKTRRHHKVKPKTKPKPKTVALTMVPTSQVYVCLVNGDGKVLIPGTIYDTGQTVPTERGKKLLLVLGNASMQIKANGRPVAVPQSSPVGLQFTPTGHSSLTAAQEPSCTS